MIKTFDTFKPASDEFPVAFAEDIDFEDGESLQEKLDNGTLGGASSEEQIKDWVSGETYEIGDYVYYDGKLYRCTTENSDVDFSGINWKNLSGSEGGDATEMETESLTPSAVGGIPAGADLNGLTSLEILTMMLYPYVKPTVSATGTPNGGTFEIGDNKTITNVRVVLGKKSKKIIKVEVLDGATSLGLLDDATIENGGTFDFPVNIEVASVNKQLTAIVTDEQGSEVSAKTGAFTFISPYYVGVCNADATIDEALVTGLTKKITKVEVFDGVTSLGLLDDATIENGGTFDFPVNVEVASVNKQLTASVTDEQGSEVTAKTGAFTFVYPYYIGVCDGNATIDEALVTGLTKKIETKATKTISYTTANQKMVFAYPVSYGAISKIYDSNNFDVTNTFTKEVISITGLDGVAVEYNVYTNGTSSVSGFNMKFQY